jgi:F-type H+-transporting ATPase subunit delta
VDGVRGEIRQLAALFDSSPELSSAVFQPLHPLAQRKAAVEEVLKHLGMSEIVRHFCALLLDRHRMDSFFAVRDELERLVNEAAGRVEAEIVSAKPLPPEQLERLRGVLAARTRREVQVQVRVDPAILGGVVAKVGDLVFDGSIRTQLAQMRANLMKGH